MRSIYKKAAGFIAMMLLFLLAVPCAAAAPAQGVLVAEYTLASSRVNAGDAVEITGEVSYYLDFSNQLTPAARNIYDALLACTEKMVDGKTPVEIFFGTGITKDLFSFADYSDAVSAFTRDHSEVFWVDFSKMTLSVYEDEQSGALCAVLQAPGGSYYISPYTDATQVQRDRQALSNGLSRALEAVDVQVDTYTQLLQMHDWLCANNTYNDDLASGDMRMFEAVSALDADPNTKPVCEGYARAYKMMCDARGIPCILVAGVAVQRNTAGAHMWNLVYLDNAWYAVDVTWDDAMSWGGPPRYSYFLAGATSYANAAAFKDSHIPNGVINSGGREFLYPKLSEKAYVYSSEPEIPPQQDEQMLLPGFARTGTYTDELFSDVAPSDWYRENVAQAYALGLMVGNGDGTFRVNGSITVAECVSIAARIHAAYYSAEIPENSSVWYEGAVRYALVNGILSEPCADYNAPVNRRTFAQILSRALPAEALEVINVIEDSAIPDVDKSEEIYLLYRAGILRGDTDGSFYPDATIRRCEVAAIVTRMVDLSLRVEFTLPSV